jgi:hypothetical protein
VSTIFYIDVQDGTGNFVQRWECNEKCYRENGTRQICICQGNNYHVGRAQAIRNTFEYCQVWYQDWIEDHEELLGKSYTATLWFQLPLPGFELIPETPA